MSQEYGEVWSGHALLQPIYFKSDRLLAFADQIQKFFNTGVETAGTAPEEFSAKIKSEMTRLGKVIRDADMRAD